MGIGGQLGEPAQILNAAVNHDGSFGELKILYSSAAAGPSSTQGYSERYIWEKVFIWFLDLNCLNARPV